MTLGHKHIRACMWTKKFNKHEAYVHKHGSYIVNCIPYFKGEWTDSTAKSIFGTVLGRGKVSPPGQ